MAAGSVAHSPNRLHLDAFIERTESKEGVQDSGSDIYLEDLEVVHGPAETEKAGASKVHMKQGPPQCASHSHGSSSERTDAKKYQLLEPASILYPHSLHTMI